MSEIVLEFKECAACSGEKNTARLCASCLHNREVIARLKLPRDGNLPAEILTAIRLDDLAPIIVADNSLSLLVKVLREQFGFKTE